MEKRAKEKMLKITIYISGIALLIFLMVTINYINNSKKYTDKFIVVLKEGREEELTKGNIEEFEKEIKKEMKDNEERSDLKKGYLSLGIIEGLNNNHVDALMHLNEAKRLIDLEKESIDMDIYTNLSKTYLELDSKEKAEENLNKAEELALKNGFNDEIVDSYYEVAERNKRLGKSINYSIDLLEKSTNVMQDYKTIINSYLKISANYKHIGEYDRAFQYDEMALGMAISQDNDEYIGKCIMSLAENYHTKMQYRKSIYLLEAIEKEDILKEKDDRLKLYSYLVHGNYNINDVEKGKIYSDKLLEEIKEIEPLLWKEEFMNFHILNSDVYLALDQIEKSNAHYNMADKLYTENKSKLPANSDLNLKKLDIEIASYNEESYKKIIKDYENLIKELEYRGLKGNLYYEVIYEIVTLSYKNNDDDTLNKYSKIMYEIYNDANISTDTDFVVREMHGYIQGKEAYKDKMKIYGLLFLILIIGVLAGGIYFTNVKIIKRNKKLLKASKTDGLTGLYNKTYMYDCLKDISEKKEEVFFVMLDIDNFKNYNDNYGHMQGDDILIKVSDILKNTFKKDLVFRYGGEEFSIISKRNESEVLEDIEKFRENLYLENIEHGYSKTSDRITLSIGVSKGKVESINDYEELIKLSDTKLYKSKSLGKDRYTY